MDPKTRPQLRSTNLEEFNAPHPYPVLTGPDFGTPWLLTQTHDSSPTTIAVGI